MEIVDHREISDAAMTELCLACFDHAHSKKRLKRMIKSDGRLPEWGGELYATENGKVLGVVGLLYPKVRIKNRTFKVGGIRNVCCRPSNSKKGVAERLMREAHKILKKEVDHSFLMTSASNVAYNLYKKLGYHDVYVPAKAFKERENTDSDVEFRHEDDPGYVRSVYTDSVNDLTGLVVRKRSFWDMAEARGWPKNENIRIAYKDGERIGYVMFDCSRNRLTVQEIGAEENFLPEILDGLESQTEKDHLVLSYGNPTFKETIEKKNYEWTQDLWYRVMKKDFNEENRGRKFDSLKTFHMGIYESY